MIGPPGRDRDKLRAGGGDLLPAFGFRRVRLDQRGHDFRFDPGSAGSSRRSMSARSTASLGVCTLCAGRLWQSMQSIRRMRYCADLVLEVRRSIFGDHALRVGHSHPRNRQAAVRRSRCIRSCSRCSCANECRPPDRCDGSPPPTLSKRRTANGVFFSSERKC